jgi:addiction module HigA family antidote
LRRELEIRDLSGAKLALALGVPASRVAAVLRGRRGINADTAVRLGRYFGGRPQFWLDLQGQYEIALVEQERGASIAEQVRPTDAA